jgi:hypothetical protein
MLIISSTSKSFDMSDKIGIKLTFWGQKRKSQASEEERLKPKCKPRTTSMNSLPEFSDPVCFSFRQWTIFTKII